MRAALAIFRVCAQVLMAGALCAACTEPARGPIAGASDAWKNDPEPSLPPAAVPRAVWDMYPEAQRWAPANSGPFTARGHQPEQQVDVHVNELARAAYVALVADTVFPDGSVLVELAHSAASPGNGYAMRKAGGQWTYLELDPRGGVLASGVLALCAGCHAQAPADRVFGLPREPASAP